MKHRFFPKALRASIKAAESKAFYGALGSDRADDVREAIVAKYLARWARCGLSGRTEADLKSLSMTDADDDGRMTVRLIGALDAWYGVDYTQIIKRMDEVNPTSLLMFVDSPGGFVADGMGLYGDLMRRAEGGCKITTEATGLVASAAVLPFLAGKDRKTRDGCGGMVHSVWGFAVLIGNAREMRAEFPKIVNPMDSLDAEYRTVVAKRTGMGEARTKSAIEAETWYTAREWKDNGFATHIADGSPDGGNGNGDDDELMAAAKSALLSYGLRRTIKQAA